MKQTPYRDGIRIPMLVAAAVAITESQMVATNSKGFAVPAHDATAKLFFGRAEHDVDNTQGADGAARLPGQGRQGLCPEPDGHPRTRRLFLRSVAKHCCLRRRITRSRCYTRRASTDYL